MKNAYEINGEVATVFLETRRSRSGAGGGAFPGSWVYHQTKHGTAYVIGTMTRNYKKERIVWMHRWIMGTPDNLIVDHVNHCGLDNRRSNLRNTNHSMNALNRAGAPSNNTTGFLGVAPQGKRWSARIRQNRKMFRLGVFDDKQSAARAVAIERERMLNA
jgi:hypothetical protein